MKSRRVEQTQYISDMAEYRALGNELKNTTRGKLAEKFEVTASAVCSIGRLTIDDFKLIQAMIADRKASLARRKHLRRILWP